MTGLGLGKSHVGYEIACLKSDLQKIIGKISKTGLAAPHCELSPTPSEPTVFSKIRVKVKWVQEEVRLRGHIYGRRSRTISPGEYWANHKARPAKYMICHNSAIGTQTG